jgi:hypothetical protein
MTRLRPLQRIERESQNIRQHINDSLILAFFICFNNAFSFLS